MHQYRENLKRKRKKKLTQKKMARSKQKIMMDESVSKSNSIAYSSVDSSCYSVTRITIHVVVHGKHIVESRTFEKRFRAEKGGETSKSVVDAFGTKNLIFRKHYFDIYSMLIERW